MQQARTSYELATCEPCEELAYSRAKDNSTSDGEGEVVGARDVAAAASFWEGKAAIVGAVRADAVKAVAGLKEGVMKGIPGERVYRRGWKKIW